MGEICWLMDCPKRTDKDGTPECIYRQVGKPCRDPVHADDWLTDVVRGIRERPAGAVRGQRSCPHCGRTWHGGDLLLNQQQHQIKKHIKFCAKLNATQRRERARKAERRWELEGHKVLTLTNNWSHPGLQLEVITDKNLFTYESGNYVMFMRIIDTRPGNHKQYECPICGAVPWSIGGRANKHWQTHKEQSDD